MIIELVFWQDSRGVTTSWSRANEVPQDGVCSMVSCGWVVDEDDVHIQIAPHIGMEPEGEKEYQVAGIMYIPKSCITDRKRVFEVKTKEAP